MSDNARPEAEQVKPVEPGPVDVRPDGSGSEPPPKSSPTELLILPTDVDEPPIYFEPDAVAPFLPAFTPAPTAADPRAASSPPRAAERAPGNGTPFMGRGAPEPPAQVVLSDIPWEPASRPPVAIVEAAFAATIPAPSPVSAPSAPVPSAIEANVIEEGRPSDPEVSLDTGPDSEPAWSSVPPADTAPDVPPSDAVAVPPSDAVAAPPSDAVAAPPPQDDPPEPPAVASAPEPPEPPPTASEPEPPAVSSEPDTLVSPIEPSESSLAEAAPTERAPVPEARPMEAIAPPSDPILLPAPLGAPSAPEPPTERIEPRAAESSRPPPRKSAPVISRATPPPRVRTGRSQRPGSSQRPPNLIEPARIIAVLGSEVPAYTKEAASSGDEIEDLDASEAQELADAVPSEREPAKADAAAPAESGSAEPASAEAPATTPEASPATPAQDAQRRAKPPTAPSARKSTPGGAAKKAWWEDMFSDDFLRAIPVLSGPQLERETLFVERSLNVPRGGRILDLACGAGQHAVELATHGYAVTGYDLSQAQLSWAGELAQERGQTLEFIHGDMRDLDFNAAFDGVYCWNTSFGFFEEEKNINIAQRVFRSLRPGGRFLLDIVNRDFIVSQQPGQTWFEGDGCVCIDDVIVDFITSRIKVKRTLMLDNGKNRECNYSIRLYNLHELGKLLHEIGFRILQVSGRPELPGIFMGPTSPRIIILAAKPA